MQYTLKEAIDYGLNNKIEEWVHGFLNDVGENKPFSVGLKKEKRFFYGPVMFNLSLINKCCCPDENVKFPEPEEEFERRVNSLLSAKKNGFEFLPLIVSHIENYLEICDGNHRHEALLREGYSKYWVILWGNKSVEKLKRVYEESENE